MASISTPLRALSRSRPLSLFHISSSPLAGPSRISPFVSRANLTNPSQSLFARPSTRVISGRRWNSSDVPPAHKAFVEHAEKEEDLRLEAPQPGAKSQQLAQIQPRLSLTFTCTADECNHRSTHEFSKQAYTKGIVLVQCPQCKNRHLIADHLGWFKESTEEGKLRTIEDLLKAKGETVRTGRVNWDGDIEYDGEAVEGKKDST